MVKQDIGEGSWHVKCRTGNASRRTNHKIEVVEKKGHGYVRTEKKCNRGSQNMCICG